MATLTRRNSFRKRLLESIGNQSAEELGALALDMMENTDRVYQELGVQDDGDGDYFEYTRPIESEEFTALQKSFNDLHEEYKRRFSNVHEQNSGNPDELPSSQPEADDMTLGIDPHTGVEMTEEGNGQQELVKEDDIFGEE